MVQDLCCIRVVLDTFAKATGLCSNISKSQFSPISCTQELIDLLQLHLPCPVAHFPIKYLGVPLSIYKLKCSELQPLVDAVADRLLSWKAGMLSHPGRTALVRSTLSAIPVHISIVVKLNHGTLRDIDKVRRGFIWCATSLASEGRCMVAWSNVTRPIELEGLGVLDLDRLGHALRLRCAWLTRVDPSRSWAALPHQEDKIEQVMFQASTSVVVGSGTDTWF
jgi:hypothetical protein